MAAGSPLKATATLARLSLRGIRAHAARLLLTLLTVVLGTGFVAGTLMLTGALDRTFESVSSSEYDGVDVAVQPGEGQRTLPPDTLERVDASPLVGEVNVHDQRSVVLSQDGSTVPTGGVPVRPVPWYPPEATVGPPMEMTEGAPPGPGEVAVSTDVAADHGLGVGAQVTVNDNVGDLPVTVSGTYPGDSTTFLGLAMNEGEYLERYTGNGLPGLTVSVAEGQDATTVASTLSDEISGGDPEAPKISTGEELAESDARTVSAGLGFIQYFLIAFGVIALLVGMFIIANTFAMTVAQRMRDFALLRALGASRGQVTGSVLVEALLIGVLGSALGVGAGAGLVTAILAVMRRTDLGLPEVSVDLSATAILVPLALGTVVTLVSGWAPARRAGSASPMAAAQDAPLPVPVVRTALGVVLAIAGTAATLVASLNDGWETGTRAGLCGVGVAGLLLGLYLFSPALSALVVPPVGRLLGAPFGSAGRLAATNARRNPRRTAGTAFALSLGLALVTMTGMLGSSMKSSVADVVESEVTADVVVGPPGGAVDVAVPGRAVDAVRETPGVGAIYTIGKAVAVVGDPSDTERPAPSLITVSNGDPGSVLDLGETEGNLDLGEGEGVTMSASFAAENGWEPGDMVPVGVPGQVRAVEMPLTGTYEGSRLLGDVVMGSSAFWDLAPGDQGMGGNRILAVAVSGDGTVDSGTLTRNLEDATADVPVVEVQTPEQFAGGQTVLVDRLVAVVYALLALAVAVAVLGVVNTLALTVVERRREIGMLRAVGMGRGQVRRMIVLESVQTALYGAVTGIAVGLFAGWSFLELLSGVGIGSITVPWGQVALVLAGSVVVGVVAAVTPAVRAARTPPLEAAEE
ncbi:MAG: ABC transporter permease [Mycobacteriaceae bacterium]|uniref:ABC transporter permease n=1 Tax=Corynebacterium sp. TaxID=1720 RepID=UPI003F9CCBDA